MRLGIIGLPSSGKTTVFNALTGEELPTGAFGGGRLEVHTAVVDVPDARLQALSDLQRPRKTTYAQVTYVDVGGLQAGAGQEGLPGPLVNQLEALDGLLHVLRAFEDPAVPHPLDDVDPQRDFEVLQSELLLHDMLTVERRLERLAEERARGGRERATVEREIALFERLAEALDQEKALRSLSLSVGELEMLRGIGLLTSKPVLAIVNLGEGQTALSLGDVGTGVQALNLYGQLEMEIVQLPPEEADAFLEEYGIETPGRQRVLRASYELLGTQTFFTLNEKEARAWTLPRGTSVLEAAGTIHSDMARGFIRAEVIAWDELLALGGLAEARAQGKLRLEGKDYTVLDGEVLYIRFNV